MDGPGRARADGALVITLPPYRYSHRAGKVARAYATRLPTSFVSLCVAGRSGVRDSTARDVIDGIDVTQVGNRGPVDGYGRLTPWLNLVRVYAPAFLDLLRAVWGRPAAVVHVHGPFMLVLAVIHRARYRSRIVLDLDERPSSASLPRSVGTLVRPLEPLLLRLLAGQVHLAVAASTGHLDLISRAHSFTRFAVVRNVPESRKRGTYRPPPPLGRTDPLVLVTVTSIFEGRCFEELVDACALLVARGHIGFEVRVNGHGADGYVQSLHDRIARLGVGERVHLGGAVAESRVADAYLDGHVALALYDTRFAHNDALPNKVLEAVSAGRPVLATDTAEVRSFVEPTGTGWLTSAQATAIADAIERLDATLRAGTVDLEQLSARCRALGDEDLTWEREFEVVLRSLDEGAPPHEPDRWVGLAGQEDRHAAARA